MTDTPTALTDSQVLEAIEQVRVHCRNAMETDYHSISMRGALYTLGFVEAEADQVIQKVADSGFTYCLDPSIEATHFSPDDPRAVNGMVTDRPSEAACYWGPDQLLSRLNSWTLR